MKMISITSMMSIIGITLGSDWIPPESPVDIAISALSLLLFGCEESPSFRLGNRRHDAGPGLPGDLHRLLNFRELQLVVRLEVENLVHGPGGVDRLQLVLQRLLRDRPAVQEVIAADIDTQNDLVVALGARVEVGSLRHRRLETGADERRYDHEDDQQHQHDVDHRNYVGRRLDCSASGTSR